MKFKAMFLATIFALSIFSCEAQKLNFKWDDNLEKHHLAHRQDSSTWNLDLLKSDLDYNKQKGNTKPIAFGAFPTPKYDLLGNDTFKGVGTGGNFLGLTLNGKTIVYTYFLANKNLINEAFLKDKPNEVFFTIVVLTDFIDSLNYSHAGTHVVSRNNPHYLGEGFYKTKSAEIDFTAFITATRDQFAIINMRLFNLNYGRTILMAPQKDGSLRSMQVSGPIFSDKEVKDYIDSILKRKEVIDFFANSQNI